LVAQGVTGRTLNIRGGGRVTAGIFDDPFFFDVLGFGMFQTNVANNVPLPDRAAPFFAPRFPVDGFASNNTLAIVVEVPRVRVQSTHRNTRINVWIRALQPDGTQFDRTALPAINAATVPPPAANPNGVNQNNFNQGNPGTDAQHRGVVSARIQRAYGVNATVGDALASAILPDIMPFNTTSGAGFNDGLTLTLNGRRLDDDVIDAEFNALTNGVLTSDRVPNNSIFRRNFPYLGEAQPVRRPFR
jgi:hypothetical protein